MKIVSLTEYLEDIKNELGSSKKDAEKIFRKIVEENVEFYDNEEMLAYVLEKASIFERHHKSRNFLVEDEESDEILGFFSLSLKVIDISELDKKEKKKLILKGKSPDNIMYIPAILIGQFGKNTLLNKITGIELMKVVIEKIQKFREIVGTQMIFLDSINSEKVICFYEQFGFSKYGEVFSDNNKNSYQPMALNLSKM